MAEWPRHLALNFESFQADFKGALAAAGLSTLLGIKRDSRRSDIFGSSVNLQSEVTQTMRIGIKPVVNFAFKKIFGTDPNKLSLISFLNAVLVLGVPIVDVVIVNPYNLQDFLDDKLSILDIKAIDANGAIYAIEIQLSDTSRRLPPPWPRCTVNPSDFSLSKRFSANAMKLGQKRLRQLFHLKRIHRRLQPKHSRKLLR